MSTLFDRVARLFEANADIGRAGLHDDSGFIPERLREAAVLVAITERDDPGILLTKRPETMPSHPGQIAFPGGKLEPGEDAVTAALREAEEELAIAPANVRLVGTAQPFATGSGFHLTPVLGVVPHDVAIRPDPREVADWFEIPLRFALDQRNHQHKTGLFRGVQRSYTEIQYGEHRIWGITAGIFANLSHRLAWWDLVD